MGARGVSHEFTNRVAWDHLCFSHHRIVLVVYSLHLPPREQFLRIPPEGTHSSP